MTQRNILIEVVIAAHPDCAESLAELLRETQRTSRTEPGCISYRFTRDLEATDLFHAFELWADAAALRAHFAAPAFQAFAAAFPALGRVERSTWRTGELAPFDRDALAREQP